MTGQDYCLSTNIHTNYKANKQNTAALKHYQISDGVSTEICGDTNTTLTSDTNRDVVSLRTFNIGVA